jgi:hypothetical protein
MGQDMPGVRFGRVGNVLKQLRLSDVIAGTAFAASPRRRSTMSVASVGAASAFAIPQSSSLSAKSKSKSDSVEQQFLKYAEMTPAQRLFDSMLKQLGLSEDDFKAMS